MFIHGHRADALRWEGFLYKLAEKFHVFAPDLPGYGRTQPLKKIHSMENYAQFIADFIDILKIENPIIFGGSMGGIVGLYLAINHLKKIKKLVLFGTPINQQFYKFNRLKLGFLKFFARRVSTGGILCKTLQTLVNSKTLWYLTLRFFLLPSEKDSRIIQYEAERWRSCSMKIWGETLFDCLNIDFQGKRERIKTPTLVIFATGDKYIAVEETLKEYKKLFENLEIVEVDIKSHLPKGPVTDSFLTNLEGVLARI